MSRLLAIFALLATLVICSTSFAQGVAAPAALDDWPALAVLACTLASYALRKFTPASNVFHSPAGAFAISLMSAALSAIASAVEMHGLHRPVVIHAMVGAVLSLLATSNPTNGKSDENRQRGAVRIELLVVCAVAALVALAGCALPLQHVPRCDALHRRAVWWKISTAATGALSGIGIATAIGLTGRTGQITAGVIGVGLGAAAAGESTGVAQSEHDYATECEGPPPAPPASFESSAPAPSPAPPAREGNVVAP